MSLNKLCPKCSEPCKQPEDVFVVGCRHYAKLNDTTDIPLERSERPVGATEGRKR